jgi:protein SCO1/2
MYGALFVILSMAGLVAVLGGADRWAPCDLAGRCLTGAAPNFQLSRASDGEQVQLADFSGCYVVLWFGYTRCDSICPLYVNRMRQVAAAAGNLPLAFVFLSLDPARDNGDRLAAYQQGLADRGPGRPRLPFFVLGSGSDHVRDVARRYGVYDRYDEHRAARDPAYQFAHPDVSYLIDRTGRLRAAYTGFDAGSLTADLRTLAAQDDAPDTSTGHR